MGSDSAKLLQIEKQRVLDVKDDEGVTALMRTVCKKPILRGVELCSLRESKPPKEGGRERRT